jgi:hypothetical protein
MSESLSAKNEAGNPQSAKKNAPHSVHGVRGSAGGKSVGLIL